MVQVGSPGAGPKLATSPTYTDNAGNVVQQQTITIGEQFQPTYTAVAPGVSASTVNSHMLEIMAGGSLNVRIRRIVMTQVTASAVVNVFSLQLWRLTSAGTGGTVVAITQYDSSDTPGATARSLPSSKGAETGNPFWLETLWASSAAIPTGRDSFRWQQSPNGKPILLAPGAGIAIKNTILLTAATWDITVEFVETLY
jgi:hypothetical protein